MSTVPPGYQFEAMFLNQVKLAAHLGKGMAAWGLGPHHFHRFRERAGADPRPGIPTRFAPASTAEIARR